MTGRAKISTVKVSNIKKLRELGYTVKKVAEMTSVSTTTVNYCTLPGFYESQKKRIRDHIRRTVLVSGPTKEGAIRFTHLNKRPYTGKCEVCGVLKDERLHYHHWDDSNPSEGLWMCFKCHRLAELVDKLGPRGVVALMSTYMHRRSDVTHILVKTVAEAGC